MGIILSSISRIPDANRRLSRPRLSDIQVAHRRKVGAEYFSAQHE